MSHHTHIKPVYKGDALELKCINTIRAVSADQPEAAQSGHPGAPMGCAPMAYLLWTELMKYSGKSPKWIARDRFVQWSCLCLAIYHAALGGIQCHQGRFESISYLGK
jgi:transketolase N-terminal domain/subunit